MKISNQPDFGSAPEKAAAQSKALDAAAQFEALLISEMLRSAREEGDAGAESLRGMADHQLGQAIASAGGLGLKDLILSGLNVAGSRKTTTGV